MDGSAGACSPKTTTKSPRKKRKCIDDSGDAGKDTTEPKNKLARPDFTEIEFKVGLKDATSRFTGTHVFTFAVIVPYCSLRAPLYHGPNPGFQLQGRILFSTVISHPDCKFRKSVSPGLDLSARHF